jgi:virginiamycin B lyase
MGSDGNLWLALDHGLGRLTPAGDYKTFSLPTPDAGAFGICASSDGNIWFTEPEAMQIGRITPAVSRRLSPVHRRDRHPHELPPR